MYNPVEPTNYDSIADIYTTHVDNELSWNNLYERPYMLSIFDNFENDVDLSNDNPCRCCRLSTLSFRP